VVSFIDVDTIFSETYSEARSKFRAAASRAGLECENHPLTLVGEQGEQLAIDVVRLGSTKPRQVILLTSGAHGVEGFAGSALQTGIIESQWARDIPSDMAIVLVHALNPHGMSWSRRECEDGTDLPRNLSHHLYPPFPNEQYELFQPLLVPPNVTAQTLASLPGKSERIMSEHGIDNATPILRSGQYTHANGLTYHGVEASWSTRRWIEITRQFAGRAEDVMMIDVHTGFGDYGDLLVQNPSYRHSSPAYSTLCQWLGREPTGYSDDGSILQHRIETFEALHRQTKNGSRVAAMYFEFGTLPPSEFIDPWVVNNWHFHNGDRSGPEARTARKKFADFHYVRKLDWKKSVWEKGIAQLSDLRDGLVGSQYAV